MSDYDLKPQDVTVSAYSSKPESAWVQHVKSGIHLLHLPTGLTVTCESERSQHQNRHKAWIKMQEKLNSLYIKPEIQVGSMVRSYDFEHTDQYFVEGSVEEITGERYKVEVHRWHVDGHDAANFTDFVYPLMSGRVEVI